MRFTHLDTAGYVLVEHNPPWIETGREAFTDYEKILPLLDFYVFENPCSSLTSRSRSVESYGWDGPWRKPAYLNRRFKDCSGSRHLFFSSSTLNGMEDSIVKAGLFDEVAPVGERACFYDNMRNQTLSCLYHLRNSFCHGRFAFLKDGEGAAWVALEDVSGSGIKGCEGKKLSARMILRLETLEAWRRLVVSGGRR